MLTEDMSLNDLQMFTSVAESESFIQLPWNIRGIFLQWVFTAGFSLPAEIPNLGSGNMKVFILCATSSQSNQQADVFRAIEQIWIQWLLQFYPAEFEKHSTLNILEKHVADVKPDMSDRILCKQLELQLIFITIWFKSHHISLDSVFWNR